MIKKLIEYIVKSIVNDASAVEIAESKEDSMVSFKLRVKQEDRGRLIGRDGRTIRSLRAVAQSAAEREGLTCTVELAD